MRLISGNIFSPHITGESTFAVQADLQPGRQSSWWIWWCGPVPSTQHLGEAVMAKTALVIWSQASLRLGLKLFLVVGSSHGVLGSAGLNHAMMLKSASTQCLPSHPPCLFSFCYAAFPFSQQSHWFSLLMLLGNKWSLWKKKGQVYMILHPLWLPISCEAYFACTAVNVNLEEFDVVLNVDCASVPSSVQMV